MPFNHIITGVPASLAFAQVIFLDTLPVVYRPITKNQSEAYRGLVDKISTDLAFRHIELCLVW